MRFSLRAFRKLAGGRRKTQPSAKVRGPRWRPTVEGLEARNLLSVSLPVPGTPGPVQVTGTSGNDQFVIRLDPANAGNLQVSDNGGASFQTAALADVTSVSVTSLQGNDVLTIDEGNGLVAKAGAAGLPITFTGGPGTDVLVVTGSPGGGASVTESFTAGASNRAGTLAVGNGTASATVGLTDVSAVIDTLTANQLTININDNNNVIRVGPGPSSDGLKTITVRGVRAEAADETLDDRRDDNERLGDDPNDDEHDDMDQRMGDDGMNQAGQGFLPFSFANKTHVTIAAAGGEHLFVINLPQADPSLQSLTINGGSGFSVVAVRNLPAGVTLTLNNVQRRDVDADATRIDELYAERLDREARPDEVNLWENAERQGLDDRDLVRAIEESLEGRTEFVKHWYRHYLGRDAQGDEEQGWARALMAGVPEEVVLSGLLNSEEFHEHAAALFHSGDANEDFVRALYQLLLNRTAGAAEVQGWESGLARIGRQGVAIGFLVSQEFRTETVGAFYNLLLHRPAEADEINAWVMSDLDLKDVREAIEESAEFSHES